MHQALESWSVDCGARGELCLVFEDDSVQLAHSQVLHDFNLLLLLIQVSLRPVLHAPFMGNQPLHSLQLLISQVLQNGPLLTELRDFGNLPHRKQDWHKNGTGICVEAGGYLLHHFGHKLCSVIFVVDHKGGGTLG